MKQRVHTRVSLRKPLRCGFTILLCSCLLFGASHCHAQETQDAAEAARLERARKEQPQKQKHVYTEDDLGRSKILTPEDEARFATQRHLQSPPSGESTQPSLDASVEVPQLPLGDIARRYRNAKLALQAPTPFHLPFDEPTFASPTISIPNVVPPRPSSSPAHPNLATARPNVILAPALTNPAPLHRIDPFTRRSASVAPNAPVAQPRTSAPAPSPELPQPNLSQKIAVPKLDSPKLSPLAAQPNPAPAPIAPPPTPQPKPDTSVAPPSPPASSSVSPVHTLTVQPGDTLWKLAQQTLGRGSRWQELLAANPGIVGPTRLAAGTKIVVPDETSTLKSRKSGTKITVEKGDTLTEVAQSQYRRATAWRCIVQANPEVADPNRIYKGQQLFLPFNCNQ